MKNPARYLLLFSFLLLFGCENYIESNEMNACFSKNDLGVSFKTLTDSEHQFQIELLEQNDPHSIRPIRIKVENKFQASSDFVSVNEGARYKIRMVLSENNAKPILLYSFWENSITESRYRTFKGENGNPPISQTQETQKGVRIFEETFKINKNEKYIMFRLFSEKGEVVINEISIEELT